jgi:1,4-alpha-glucan branching enzyme
MNNAVHREFKGVLTIAEESTAFAGVTRPPEYGGLGFNFKWNMGWMNDTLRYIALDPVHRRYNHRLITFSFVYAWSENFILPISHDEVVHGKHSLLGKMPGDDWQRRANFRLLLSLLCAHPGKKLLFMGSEFGQWHEWRDHGQLEWSLLATADHQKMRDCVRALNHLYLATPQFHGSDCDPEGFRWVELHNADESVWAYARRSVREDPGKPIICIFNATPVPRDGYEIGVADAGRYRKLFDSDDVRFGGSGYNGQNEVEASSGGDSAQPLRLRLNLPPLAAMFFVGPLP